MDLSVRHIDKRFKNRTVLEDISFDVGPRELVSIVGPSGVGKTTLLAIIARLESPDAGEVRFSRIALKGIGVFDPATRTTGPSR